MDRRTSWTDDEPGAAEMRADLGVAWHRARKSILRTFAVAVLLTAALVGWRAAHPPRLTASIVVRVTERQFDEDTAPPSSGELNQRIHESFLGRTTLLELIEELDLYPDKMGPDPSLALAAFRDDLDVSVVQNYFDSERYVTVQVRSARIVVAYSGRTPEQAVRVVRAIGEQISRQQSERRRLAAKAAALRAQMTQQALYAQLDSLAQRQAELNLMHDTSPLAVVQVHRVTDRAKDLEAELDVANQSSARYQLRGELEAQQMGMRFELVDSGRRPTPPMSRRHALMLTGALGFLLFLPLSGLVIGVWSAVIDHPRSISRRGITCLGRLQIPHRERGISA